MNPEIATKSLGGVASEVEVEERLDFIRKTYAHLAGAVGVFVLLEVALFHMPGAEKLAATMTTGWNWLLVLGAFMVTSMIAHKMAMSATSPGVQYAGLGLYTVIEALICFPLIYLAARFGGESILPTAAGISLAIFGVLTGFVFVTKKDFSWLQPVLMVGMVAVFGLIVCSVIFGFSLGLVFAAGVIALMSGYILYETSNVLHHYRIGQHVAASLALFAALATLFYYVLYFLMLSDD